MQACPPGRAPERFFPVRASRFHPARPLAARYCPAPRDRMRRSSSVRVSSLNSSRADKACRLVILCARLCPANPPRGRSYRRVRTWLLVFPSFRPSLRLVSPLLPARECRRRVGRFTRGHAPASRRVPVRVDRASRWVQARAVRRCAVGGHIPPRRYLNLRLRLLPTPAVATPPKSAPSNTTGSGTAKANSEASARASRNPPPCP